MVLDEYHKKRNFGSTPEPRGGPHGAVEGRLRFVVHKHLASHLHYDLRLEAAGVLKSWAVPKGPSLNPTEKRLAMMVEDHPLDYRNFEGVIPEGNYGAGPVMIWDEGTYRLHEVEGRRETERAMLESVAKGNIAFFLEGARLNGWFHLTRLRSAKQENSWLLFKKHDEFAADRDILEQDRSVRTGRTIDQIRADETSDSTVHQIDITKLDLRGAPRSGFPAGPITPMLAQLVDRPFDGEGWVFEIKWDGYRSIAEVHRDSLAFYSRKGVSFVDDYPDVAAELRTLGFEAVLDGELVVVDEEGRANFGELQNFRRTRRGTLMYYVFDLLYLEGHDLRSLPLLRRKELLSAVLPDLPHIRYNEHVASRGLAFYDAARAHGIEGMVAKEAASPYLPGLRTHHWQKIKISLRQEFVIGGFTEPRGGRTGLGALVVGVYEGDNLVYAGHVGGGFTDRDLAEVRARLEKIARPTSPFVRQPRVHMPATWVEPILVGEVRFAEWTAEGVLRQPVFLGFRDDLDPRQVRREVPSNGGPSLVLHDRSAEQDRPITIDGKPLKLTNLTKIYWPRDNLTKGDMIDYYRDVAPWILPHLLDRPQSLHRFPDGIEGKSFFHKDVNDAPQWARVVPIESDTESRVVKYLLCQDEASLVYMVNLGAIEINPWISRLGNLDRPDFCVVDLDPLDIGFDEVVRTAQAIGEVLDRATIPGFVKTSGATGMHIFIPLAGRYSYEQSRQFSQIICSLVHHRLPATTSLERLPEKRRGRVYLDFLQNVRGKTMASVYSLRPRPGAPVSTPLRWDEVQVGLSPEDFTLRTVMQRLERFGDLWRPLLDTGIDMNEALGNLVKLQRSDRS